MIFIDYIMPLEKACTTLSLPVLRKPAMDKQYCKLGSLKASIQ